jgi:predicted SAM-dependent methyltransferase
MQESELYVQYGCGFSPGEGWLNFDSSPTLRIERIPIIGIPFSTWFSGNPTPFPPEVQYGDVRAGLPVAPGSVRGCYASHVLEHLSLQECRAALANTFTMLAPGGVFRLIVPDLLARAKRYVDSCSQGAPDAAETFLCSTLLGRKQRPRTLLQHLRVMLGGSHHLWMWDELSLSRELQRTGFVKIRRCEFGDAADAMFAKVESRNRFVEEDTNIVECALEAHKPG